MSNVLDLIIGLRGGYPDGCDWCGKPLLLEPIPEEAGQWICVECEKAQYELEKKQSR